VHLLAAARGGRASGGPPGHHTLDVPRPAPPLRATPVTQRWVEDGHFITAAGVSAGIDMALHLVGRLADRDVARMAQLFIEYDPEPPLGPIDWPAADSDQDTPFAQQLLHSALADHPALLAHLST
jgi:hypothetical protein